MSSATLPVHADPASAPGRRRADFTVIGLIGLAHGTSHFFHMLLPPLFPAFMQEFGLSFSQLGLLVTVFFVISGVGQALSGFVVDRVGARPVLMSALACLALAALAAAAAQGLGGLVFAAALAGLGNSPFHPSDFTILNRRVSPSRLGHAFSLHGVSGNLGWAVGPVFMIGISTLSGNWRWACVAAALWALAVLALLLLRRKDIDDRHDSQRAPGAAAPLTASAQAEPALAFLKLPSVWLCFSFFFWSTAALAAMQSFAGPALSNLYALPLAATASVVTGYMLCGGLGILAGGFLVGRVAQLERTIAMCMTVSALLLLLVSLGWLPATAAAVVTALAGFGTGLAGPSRDLLIKRAAPPGATGRVYGTVYSGLDAGFALSAPVFGWLLDRGHAAGVFSGAALSLMLGVGMAALVALYTRQRPPMARTAQAD